MTRLRREYTGGAGAGGLVKQVTTGFVSFKVALAESTVGMVTPGRDSTLVKLRSVVDAGGGNANAGDEQRKERPYNKWRLRIEIKT